MRFKIIVNIKWIYLQCCPLGAKEGEESFMIQDKFQAERSEEIGGTFVADSIMLRPANKIKSM